MSALDENYIRNRITELRQLKNISESQMSFDLGHSRNYVQSITSGKSCPSVREFLKICKYFELTPSEFFDSELKNPQQIQELTKKVSKLPNRDITMLMTMIDRLLELIN